MLSMRAHRDVRKAGASDRNSFMLQGADHFYSPSQNAQVGSSRTFGTATVAGTPHTEEAAQFFGVEDDYLLDDRNNFFSFDTGLEEEDRYKYSITKDLFSPALNYDLGFEYRWENTSNATQLDFTPFLERLDDKLMESQMMDLIARYFHNGITVFKNDRKIFNIHGDFSDSTFQKTSEDESAQIGGARVLCSIDLSDKSSPEVVREFLNDADDLLDSRDDLKNALRSVFPPTIATSGFGDPIFSSPMARKKRKAARNNTIRAKIAAMYHNELDAIDSKPREKKIKKRGRPRKNTMTSTIDESPVVTALKQVEAVIVEIPKVIEAEVKPVPPTSPNSPPGSVKSTSKSSKKKKEMQVDDEWKPEKKRPKVSTKKNEADKKLNKLKTPSDKAKEEQDLFEMGLEALEEHIGSLQFQLRDVKHKHRKGTICPRCTTEQRLKLAFKARNRAQNDIKVKPGVPVVLDPEQVSPAVVPQREEPVKSVSKETDIVMPSPEPEDKSSK